MKIERAPVYDWRILEAARENAHTQRSETAFDITTAIVNKFRRLFRRADDTRGALVSRCVDAAKAASPLERGLRVGWY